MKINFLVLCFIALATTNCNNKFKGLYCSVGSTMCVCINFLEDKKFHFTEFSDNPQEGFGTYNIKNNQIELNFGQKIECVDCLSIKKEGELKDSVHLVVNNLSEIGKYHLIEYFLNSVPFEGRERPGKSSYEVKYPFNEKAFVRMVYRFFPSIVFEISEPGVYKIDFQFQQLLEGQITNRTRTYNIPTKNKNGMTIQLGDSKIYKFNMKKNFECISYKESKPFFRKNNQ